MAFGDFITGGGAKKIDAYELHGSFNKASGKKAEKDTKDSLVRIHDMQSMLGLKTTKQLETGFEGLRSGTKHFESMVADINRMEFLEKAQVELGKYDMSLTDAKGNLKSYGETTKDMIALKDTDAGSYNNLIKRLHIMEAGINESTDAFSRFKGEMMSVMFFGMQVAATFGSMLEPSKKMAGTAEILSAILGLMFLPEILSVNDALFDFWNYMDRHPELEGMIKGLTLLGYALGTVGFYLGVFGLGITGLKDLKMWIIAMNIGPRILGWALGIKKAILAISGPVLIGAIIVLVLAIRTLHKHWDWFKERFKLIISGIKEVVYGFGNTISGVFTFLKGAVLGDFDLMKEGIDKVIEGIKRILGGFETFVSNLTSVIRGLIIGMVLEIGDIVNWATNLLGFGDIIDVDKWRNMIFGPTIPGATATTTTTATSFAPSGTVNVYGPVVRRETDIDEFVNRISEAQNRNMTELGGLYP